MTSPLPPDDHLDLQATRVANILQSLKELDLTSSDELSLTTLISEVQDAFAAGDVSGLRRCGIRLAALMSTADARYGSRADRESKPDHGVLGQRLNELVHQLLARRASPQERPRQ